MENTTTITESIGPVTQQRVNTLLSRAEGLVDDRGVIEQDECKGARETQFLDICCRAGSLLCTYMPCEQKNEEWVLFSSSSRRIDLWLA